jgi:hypothetical protein
MIDRINKITIIKNVETHNYASLQHLFITQFVEKKYFYKIYQGKRI